ncbi:MAG: outer membrane protein [Bacteroidetes bacterium]|nr:outer membrane protein [Bacteroidota bacterium]
MVPRFLSAHVKVSAIILAILCLSIVNDALGSLAVIQQIKFSGNTVFTQRQLGDDMSSRPSLVYSTTILQKDILSIVDRYRKAGYIDVTVSLAGPEYSLDSSNVDVSLSINEGRQTLVGNIVVTGHSHFTPDEVLSRFETKPGEPLDELTLEQDIDELLTRYERSGYPLSQCEIANVARRSGVEIDSLDVTLTIDEGQRVTIDEIQVQGNKETDPAVVVRETRLAVGETFNPVKIDAIRPRLQRLNIFSDVSEPELYTRNSKGGLLIKVREGNTNTFDGVIGYIPSTSTGEGGYVTGLASISMRNLFGTGRKLNFHWQREDRHSQELGVRYVEPWIFSFPVNLGGGFFQRQQDTSYVRRALDFKAELMLSDELSASLLFGSESVIPSADSGASRVFRSLTTSFGVELLYDTRDDIISPTSGARYRTDYSFGNKHISNIPAAFRSIVPGRVTVQRFTLDLDFYLSTFTRQVLAVGFHGRELRSGQLEEGDLFRLGGTRTLRGYRENQFIGSRIAWSNTEYRLLLARRSFIYGFLDGGYYLRPADAVRSIPKTDSFKYGYGIGVQLETGLGNLGVSFALGQGDTFATGKIHFGLINEF